MDTTLTTSQSSLLLSLSGNLDYQEARLAENIFSKLNTQGNRQLIVDLRGVKYISSAGLLLFKKLSENHSKNGRLPQIKGASHFLHESFELAGIDDLFVWLEEP